jgi:hypothetical protein
MKELTLTRALAELKLLDSKISKAIQELKSVSYSVNNIVPEFRVTSDEFKANYNSQMQSIQDLRNNKVILKNALMKANTETKVTIGGKEYTILEALNRKTDISTESLLVQTMKKQLSASIANVNSINNSIESNIENTIRSKSASSGNQSKDYIQTVRDSYKPQMPELVNADVVEKLIKDKEEEISEFIAEVDYALSEINAITKIKVDLK